MKKFLAMVLSAAMTISAAAFTYADGYMNIGCEMSSSEVQVGDTFYADFKVYDNANGYNTMTAYLKYDPSVIKAVDCEIEDIPSDLIMYQMDNGAMNSLFSYSYVNGRINFIPKSGDSDYDGYADGSKTASEIGIIKLTNYLGASVDGYLQNYQGTGTILRMKFVAIASGSSAIELTDASAAYFDKIDGDKAGAVNISLDISSGYINVTGGEEPTETTTEAAATTEATSEATTAAPSGGSSSSGSSSGGGSSSSTKPSAEVTTETAEETTTASQPSDSADNTVTTDSISFKDVAADAWYHDYVISLASKGVINGYNDNTFKPNDNVKRADFLLMLLRGMGIDTTKAPKSNFADVQTGKYYYNAVGIAKEMGIASGDGTNYNPESNITRQDMMVLAKKALEIATDTAITGNSASLDVFNDKADISAYAVDSLAAMVEAGIVNGMGDGIAPKANTTRAQSAVIISKIMEKL